MKRWQGAMVPLPLGSRFGKENLAWKLQDPLTPGTPNMAERGGGKAEVSRGEVGPKVWAAIWRQFLSLLTLC